MDLRSLLVAPDRDFIISKTGEEVKVDELQGKVVCLYFSTFSSQEETDSSRAFTPLLTKVYEDLKSKDEGFEVVLVSCDADSESFQAHHKETPWLAIPFSDSATRTRLCKAFEVKSLPRLVVFNRQGKVANRDVDAHQLVIEQGAEAFKNELPSLESLESLFGSDKVYLLRHQVDEVMKITDVKQNSIGLFFSAHSSRRARAFTGKLISAYKQLKARQEDFEIIFISTDQDLESFTTYYNTMPWLAVPFNSHVARSNLVNRFHVREVPQLIILDASGGVVTTQGCSLVQEFGSKAFPFTPGHVSRLRENRRRVDVNEEETPGDEEHERVGGGGSHGTHVWIINNAQPGAQCSICNRHGNGWVCICKECSYGFLPEYVRGGGARVLSDDEADDQIGNEETGYTRRRRSLMDNVSTPRMSKKSLSWLGSWLDPEIKRTIIGSVMAGLLTVVVGVCSFCCSKLA